MSLLSSLTSTLEGSLFHKEQIETTKKIVQSFETYRAGLMMAQMQSGKTTTFLCTSCLMLALDKVEQVYIICGSNENELYSQLKKDIHNVVDSFILKNEEILDKSMKLKIKFGISAYKSYHMDMLEIPDHTLVIWDESHYAQSKKNKPAVMLERNGIVINGSIETKTSCISKDCYVLSISATPFSELINFIHTKDKFFIQMEPGIGYKGVQYYYETGYILESYPIQTNPFYFEKVLEKHTNPDYKSYGIVRATSDNYSTIKKIASSCGWKVVIYTSSNKKVLKNGLNDLKEQPETDTLIVLDGMCRMGKVVPKEFVSFVYESNQTKKMDTILQSLLGRMCGYGPFNPNGTSIYIPSYFIQYPHEDEIVKAKAKIMDIARMYSSSTMSEIEKKNIYDELIRSFKLFNNNPLGIWIETNMGKGSNILMNKKNQSVFTHRFESLIPEKLTNETLVDMVCFTSNKKKLRKTGNIGNKDRNIILSEIVDILVSKKRTTHLFQNSKHYEEVLYILSNQQDSVIFKNINASKQSISQDISMFDTYVEHKKPYPIISNNSKYIQSNKRICIVFDDSNPTFIGICGYSLFQNKNTSLIEPTKYIVGMFETTGDEVYSCKIVV